MTATTPSTCEVVSSGGFRIEMRPGELTVTADRAARPRSKFIVRIFAIVFVGLYVSVVLLPKLTQSSSSWLFLALLFVIFSVQYLFRRHDDLHCTLKNLEVIRVVCSKVRGTRSFPRECVKRIRFGQVAYSRYGGTTGLIFTVDGKQEKILYGLECIEAQKILDELQRLGYDIVRDVGMRMMVEMAESRRKRWYQS